MRLLSIIALCVCVCTCSLHVFAQSSPPSLKDLQDLEKRFRFQTGKISLRGLADINLPAGYRYLDTNDGRYLVETIWGNPPEPDILGVIIPPGQKVPECWAMILSFEAEGYVDDDDARDMNYGDLLKDMQKSSRDSAAEMRKRGYPVANLLGWAEPPHYDSQAHKLYWAKRLQFESDPAVTLNYDVRILGRRGVLVLTAVADEADLSQVAEGCKAVLGGTEFTSGNRYEEFDPKIDKIAAYGIGGLIAGKLLLKAGIIKALIKPIIIGGAVLLGIIGKIFGFGKKTA